jgi:hypothetical protein
MAIRVGKILRVKTGVYRLDTLLKVGGNSITKADDYPTTPTMTLCTFRTIRT